MRAPTRDVEWLALAGMVVGLALLVADRLRHRVGFVVFVPRGARAAGVVHGALYLLRTRPALVLGLLAIIVGLAAALYAAIAELARLVSARRTR